VKEIALSDPPSCVWGGVWVYTIHISNFPGGFRVQHTRVEASYLVALSRTGTLALTGETGTNYNMYALYIYLSSLNI
jgi:hypothetical protein